MEAVLGRASEVIIFHAQEIEERSQWGGAATRLSRESVSMRTDTFYELSHPLLLFSIYLSLLLIFQELMQLICFCFVY